MRGFLLDISRDKIPTLDSLERVVDRLAELKYNQLQLYVEGLSFAYPSFEPLWRRRETPLTGAEIQQLGRILAVRRGLVKARSRSVVARIRGALLMLAASAAMAAAEEVSERLLAAAARGDAAQLAALLDDGGEANARDVSQRPALLLAVASGRPEAVRTLLRAGARPDAGDPSGWTPLHEAVSRADLVSARALLDAGATADLRSRARGTALDVAERGGHAALARLLRSRGARGSGKSIGDTVCVRLWAGDGYCGVVLDLDETRFRLRLTEVVGCAGGCAADDECSAGRPVGGAGLGSGDVLFVPASCLTHTGVSR